MSDRETSTPINRERSFFHNLTQGIVTRSRAARNIICENPNTILNHEMPGDEESNSREEGNSRVDTAHSSTFKEVITWIAPFDGSRDGYDRFTSDCDRAFKAIEIKSRFSLINFILAKLKGDEFKVINGTQHKTWADLKRSLDEHFQIRLDEKNLFREITVMSRERNESMFSFYNRLIAKVYNYKKFLLTTMTLLRLHHELNKQKNIF